MPRAIGPRLALFYGAAFAAVGVQLPFWPVWLDAQGLSAGEIGLVLAAAFWPRVVTNLLVAYRADRVGRRKPTMVGRGGRAKGVPGDAHRGCRFHPGRDLDLG